MLTLTREELQILAFLESRPGWLTSIEVADDLGIAPFHARGSLKAMTRFQLVERGQDQLTVGKWRITGAGQRELNERQQLRIV